MVQNVPKQHDIARLGFNRLKTKKTYKTYLNLMIQYFNIHNTGELGYDGLYWTRKIGPSYAKSVIYI